MPMTTTRPAIMESFAEFFKGYVTCALWSSMDDNDIPLDRDYCTGDIDGETEARMMADCAKFMAENLKALTLAVRDDPAYRWDNAGHDFWLSRNGHGAGFFDRDMGDRLQAAARKFGEYNLHVAGGVVSGD